MQFLEMGHAKCKSVQFINRINVCKEAKNVFETFFVKNLGKFILSNVNNTRKTIKDKKLQEVTRNFKIFFLYYFKVSWRHLLLLMLLVVQQMSLNELDGLTNGIKMTEIV